MRYCDASNPAVSEPLAMADKETSTIQVPHTPHAAQHTHTHTHPGGFRAKRKPHGNSTSILSAAHFEASMTWTLKSDHTCLKHGGELSGESNSLFFF